MSQLDDKNRILGALKDIGFIDQDVRGRGYMLGIGLYELGSVSLANMDLHREAQPFFDQLARQSAGSVHLGVFNGHAVVVIEREDFDELPCLSVAPGYPLVVAGV